MPSYVSIISTSITRAFGGDGGGDIFLRQPGMVELIVLDCFSSHKKSKSLDLVVLPSTYTTCQETSSTDEYARSPCSVSPSIPRHQKRKKILQANKMESAAPTAGDSSDPPLAAPPEDPSPVESSYSYSSSSSAAAVSTSPAAPPGAREVAAAMEAVERDAAAIADSYASLFASLRAALSNVTSTSAENMECLGDVVGRLQESALEVSSKGNKYINSCLRLNEEIRGLESLAMQLKTLRKNVDSLDSAVNQLLRLP